MRTKTLILKMIAGACLLTTLMACTANENDIETPIDLSLADQNNWVISNAIFYHINQYRKSQGKTILIKDPLYATAYAVEHSKYMIETQTINHHYFFARKRGLINIGASHVSENIAYAYSTPESVVNAWIKNDAHKKTLQGNYSHIGFGVLKSENGRYYYTALFYKKS
ncbi:hypothetical protein BFR04_06430 [Gaetbulibacter sp. 4G1]|nr:CAP domain-containing protein [Gaetbulibacter sp. 4G1]PIA79151.1 hypothetical protein BFR04_06430 [Gaetbulibacter sp. 4G1]